MQTMKMMDEAFTKLLLVFDEEKFLGIITNGDFLRTIIAHTPFDTPIGKIVSLEGKLYAHVGDNRENIKKWMLSKRTELMPMMLMYATIGEVTDVLRKAFVNACAIVGKNCIINKWLTLSTMSRSETSIIFQQVSYYVVIVQ